MVSSALPHSRASPSNSTPLFPRCVIRPIHSLSLMSARSLVIAAVALLSSCASSSHRNQEVDWFQSGYYAGIQVGRASSDASASDIDSDLAERGYTTSTKFSDDENAISIYGGFRFEEPFSIEVGYSNLGQVESQISATPADPAAFLDDVADVHPFLARGFELRGRWHVLERDRLDVSLAGGLWFWEAEVIAEPAVGGSARVDESGVDFTLGIQVAVELNDHLDFFVAFDRRFIDRYDADVFWIGIQGSVDSLLAAIRGATSPSSPSNGNLVARVR